MFVNEDISNEISQNPTVSSRLKLIAEWNLNTPDNLQQVGNYRYRPAGSLIEKYNSLVNIFDPYDLGDFYSNATNSDIALDGVNIDSESIELFSESQELEKMLFSLEDCFGRFRPRSGINKIRYGITKFLHHDNPDLVSRPRYYMADKKDAFKYWTSYRNESTYLHSYSNGSIEYSAVPSFYDSGVQETVFGQNLGSSEYGIASNTVGGVNYISDAAPFVVYKNSVPANRIIVKMQTNVGSVDLGSIASAAGFGADPLFANEYRTTPSIWKIQYLSENVWVDAISFNENSIRPDGSPIVGNDGYVEIAYGIIVPEQFSESFNYLGEILSEVQLPQEPNNGDAFWIRNEGLGKVYIAQNNRFTEDNSFVPSFGWSLVDETTKNNFVVTKLINPKFTRSPITGSEEYFEFVNIDGLRVVVTAMENRDAVFDLIEISPRLVANISDMVESISITKNMSDLGISGLPVGQLLAAVGSLSLFDNEGAFNYNNENTILKFIQTKNIQFKVYESVMVNGRPIDVPIKTMYSDDLPAFVASQDSVSIDLRDLFFYFESLRCPEIFATNVSLSYAVSLLMDSIGFSNYTFRRLATENDPIIPYFYTSSDTNIADALNSLAVSFQHAMYFDEYNNLVVASRGYILPSAEDRSVDHVFTSSIKNENGVATYPDIIDLSSISKDIFTGGEINYTSRYIQKSEASSKQTYMLAKDKTWVYKPSLLWEVSAPPNIRATNEPAGTQAAYSLSAIPLNSDLDQIIPTVINGQIQNNIMDLGEGVYWLGKYNGYFYANGEIIKFDAVEYAVSGVAGNVWIKSVDEYQYFFSKLLFNGKMYPTGRIRIYAEPYYDEFGGQTIIRNGEVRKHGRAQFGTKIAYHSAGINRYWTGEKNVRGFSMKSEYLFGEEFIENNLDTAISAASPAGSKTPAGKNAIDIAKQSKRSGTIKNYIANPFDTEIAERSKQTVDNDMVQSSALIFEGPEIADEDSPVSFISYVRKVADLRNRTRLVQGEDGAYRTVDVPDRIFKHFGTRMRIIGELKDNIDLYQSASGATAYYDTESSGPTSEGLITGGGGGIACMLNSESNVGYFFEIAALNKGTKSGDEFTLDDVFFYKIQQNENGDALPVRLWSASAGITVDSGRMVGQSRVFAQETQTVYDLFLEYEDAGTSRTFYLYINGTQVATVIDENPLPIYGDMALFVRGASKCMFENIYALKPNYSINPSKILDAKVSDAFGTNNITINESFNKYAISGIVQQTYLSNITTTQPPEWDIDYEEFGTIMREAAYFDIKYDKAYPALYSKIVPSLSEIKGYVVSGYRGTAYGAEFLVFNATDTTIILDENSGNFLKIQGIAFTQNTANKLTVDDYFNLTSDFSPSTYSRSISAGSELRQEQKAIDLKSIRRLYGLNEFSIDAEYIQTQDQAVEVMGWLSDAIMKPRLAVGIRIYPNPLIQLGDIVSVDYVSNDGEIEIDSNKRFVVYSIDYDYSNGPNMTIFLSEVN